MKLYETDTDSQIVAELGRRHKALRISAGLTQEDQAQRAGVTRSTVQRFERGLTIQLDSLIKLLKTLDRIDALDALLPEAIRSPLAELEQHGQERQRVRRRATETTEAAAWSWADEEDEAP